MIIAVVLATSILLTGCAGDGNIYDNIYHGLQSSKPIVNPLYDQRPAHKPMTYQEYEAERKKLNAAGQ